MMSGEKIGVVRVDRHGRDTSVEKRGVVGKRNSIWQKEGTPTLRDSHFCTHRDVTSQEKAPFLYDLREDPKASFASFGAVSDDTMWVGGSPPVDSAGKHSSASAA